MELFFKNILNSSQDKVFRKMCASPYVLLVIASYTFHFECEKSRFTLFETMKMAKEYDLTTNSY